MVDVVSIFYEALITSLPLFLIAMFVYVLLRRLFHDYLKVKEYQKDEYRQELERELYQINNKLSSNEERFKQMNHLVIQGNINVDNNSSFFNKLGINENLAVKNNQVFVLTPMNKDFSQDYNWVEKAFLKHKYICMKGDDVMVQSNLLSHIIKEIAQSKFVVANISGRNPNVFYELGIAHALGKDVLLIARSEKDITFDLSSSQIVVYSEQKQLESSVSEWLVSTLNNSPSVS
ncbi:conserved hypothetical protein [Vibrio crassostreae]|uniref:hypothetical protein n=1 Tax=Vibrio crassostreae TaxID=246167 RepID=UPI001043F257|nr:hypothetical protein [Vibrio crassostreae]TCT41556.1 hypothetical protein EDB29_103350 [Vibrio crassostreae]TCV63825.1 hypothetical protein EDB74_102173 [Vibrio crassostreae]CAK2936043.1 conserved hypothetical protein [Vibrio crassostreae]CAK2990094.1 conserved hypothetical protein [Vibrio crassostreae]